MVQRLTGPNAVSAFALAKEMGLSQPTLSRWLRERGSSARAKRWTPEEKYRVVMEAAAVRDEDLGALLRREGLHEADLERFRQEVQDAGRTVARAGTRPLRSSSFTSLVSALRCAAHDSGDAVNAAMNACTAAERGRLVRYSTAGSPGGLG
jgi:transposase